MYIHLARLFGCVRQGCNCVLVEKNSQVLICALVMRSDEQADRRSELVFLESQSRDAKEKLQLALGVQELREFIANSTAALACSSAPQDGSVAQIFRSRSV